MTLPGKAALQQAKQHSYADQSQRRLSLKLRGLRLPGRPVTACRRRLPAVCGQLALIFSFRPPSPSLGDRAVVKFCV